MIKPLDKNSVMMQMPDIPLMRGRIPCLDGWRACSIALVVFSHSRIVHWAGDLGPFCGIFGVRFFFVISGFLITWLLLREGGLTGNISLRNFYIRRMLRIFPVYYTFLATCWLLEATGIAINITSSSQWCLSAFFLANYGPCKGPTGGLWSLGVEEQFYLLWPLMFVGLGLYRKKGLPVGLLITAIVVAPILRGLKIVMDLNEAGIFGHRFSFFHHMDMLAIGCLGALLVWHYPGILHWIGTKWKSVVPLSLFSLSLPFLARDIQGLGIETVFGPTMQALGLLFLVLSSISSPTLVIFRILHWQPIVWLGTISYSLYLWHSVFLTGRYFGDNGSILVFLGLPVGVLVAALSYHYLEMPILGLRRRYRVNDPPDGADRVVALPTPAQERPTS